MNYEKQLSEESPKDMMSSNGSVSNSAARYWGMDEPTFSMLLHLSSFMGMAVPFAGIVLPIVMWATNKNESSVIDALIDIFQATRKHLLHFHRLEVHAVFGRVRVLRDGTMVEFHP